MRRATHCTPFTTSATRALLQVVPEQPNRATLSCAHEGLLPARCATIKAQRAFPAPSHRTPPQATPDPCRCGHCTSTLRTQLQECIGCGGSGAGAGAHTARPSEPRGCKRTGQWASCRGGLGGRATAPGQGRAAVFKWPNARPRYSPELGWVCEQ